VIGYPESRLGACAALAVWLALTAACSPEAPPPSADILAEVLAEAGERDVASLSPQSLSSLPATFVGVLPCADCPGVRYHLNLYRDLTYFLRLVHLGGDYHPIDDVGRWTLEPDRRTLSLRGNREAVRFFVIKDDRTLTKLDMNGEPIESDVPHDLAKTEAFEPFEPILAVQGLYSRTADAATFTECLSGQEWPVAADGASESLERAYDAVRRTPGERVLASVEGRVAMPASAGSRRAALVIDRVVNVWAGRTCGMRVTAATFDRLPWRLTRLGGSTLDAAQLASVPFLEFRPDEGQFAGSDGCNRLIGHYRQDGSRLTFSVGAVTRTACPGADRVSTAFSDALAATRSWRLNGQILEFEDAGGLVVARFEPRR
jgi:copper homeostasis protein (lipoprotein)